MKPVEEKKLPWMKWNWTAWKSDPGVRASSLEARGLWVEMLAIMSEAEPHGHLLINGKPLNPKSLAMQAGGGATPERVTELVQELLDNGVFSMLDDGHTIYSRRMVRDRFEHLENIKNGKKGGNPKLKKPKSRSGL